jgi:hypothetical protein
MKPALKLAACLAFLAPLAACGDAKLDVSDAQRFTASIQKMYDSVEGGEREDFLKYFFIAMNGRSDLITLSVLSGDEISRLDSYYKVLSTSRRPEELEALDGLTPGEVVELGKGLKTTYLEGRLQEIQREIDGLRDASSFFKDYSEQLSKVEVALNPSVEPAKGVSGKVGAVTVTVTVRNGSDLAVVDIQRGEHGPKPWELEVSLGESRFAEPLSGESFLDADGRKVFPSPGIPPSKDIDLTLRADASPMGWAFPPEMPLKAQVSGGLAACLTGWERVFEAQDSYRRVMDLERTQAVLTSQLAETRG